MSGDLIPSIYRIFSFGVGHLISVHPSFIILTLPVAILVMRCALRHCVCTSTGGLGLYLRFCYVVAAHQREVGSCSYDFYEMFEFRILSYGEASSVGWRAQC